MMKKCSTIQQNILEKITRSRLRVFIRKDFTDLAGYNQVGRVLRQLTQEGKLIKIGYGLYAKAKVSSLTKAPVPVASLPVLAREAVKRLGMRVRPTTAELDYQAGKSTQVPTGLIGVNGRIARKIGYQGASVYYERASRETSY